MKEHEEELAALYAIGALPAAEARAFEPWESQRVEKRIASEFGRIDLETWQRSSTPTRFRLVR